MADNNESFIVGLIRSINDKKKRKRLLKNVENENSHAKGIVNYLPSQIEAFFNNQSFPSNIIVSGGINEFRTRAIVGASIAAYNQQIPIIIIHANNKLLESNFNQTFGSNNIVCINQNNPIYDPLIGLSNLEICKLIMDSATNGCEIKSSGKYYLDGITDFMRTKGVNPFIDMFLDCPHLQLFDKIDQAENSGQISPLVAQDIRSKLTQGQIERNNVEHYFDTLNHQGNSIFSKKINLYRAESIRKVVQHKGIILIDILSSSNSQVINIIANEVINLLSSGQKLLLITDSITIDASEVLNKIVKSNFNNCSYMMASEDAYSALSSNDNTFSSFVGSCSKFIIYHHNSAISATKWSQVIGDYDKKEISTSIVNTSNYQSTFSIIPGKIKGDNLNIGLKRENKVKPEEIMKMKPNTAYIYDAQIQELSYVEIV